MLVNSFLCQSVLFFQIEFIFEEFFILYINYGFIFLKFKIS